MKCEHCNQELKIGTGYAEEEIQAHTCIKVSDCCGAKFFLDQDYDGADEKWPTCYKCGKHCTLISPQQKEQVCGMCGHDQKKGCGCPCHEKKEVCGALIHVGFEGATTCAGKKGDCIMHDWKFCANTECEWEEGKMKSVPGGHMHRKEATEQQLVKAELAYNKPQEKVGKCEHLAYKGQYKGNRGNTEVAGSHGAQFFLFSDVRDLLSVARNQAFDEAIAAVKEISVYTEGGRMRYADGFKKLVLHSLISKLQEDNTKSKA